MGKSLKDSFVSSGKKKFAAITLTAAFAMAGSGAAFAGPYSGYRNDNPFPVRDYSYSDLVRDAENGNVQEITQKGDQLIVRFNDKQDKYILAVPGNENVYERFNPMGVEVGALPAEKPAQKSGGGGIPTFILLIGGGVLFWFIFQRMQMQRMQNGQGGGQNDPRKMMKSKAKLFEPGSGERKTFDDIAGADEAKEDLQEIIEFLKTPDKFGRLGGKVPKGVLLVGPPGTGKTLTARAVAGEAGVPFFQTSGSDFVEMYVGVGASRVRDMFEEARKRAPCILFIDEIDAIGKQRGGGVPGGGSNDEREQTLNQILTEMDGFDGDTGVIVVAATNRDDVLDKALLRPGRFDRKVVVPLPDLMGRKKILEVHMKTVPIGPDVSSLKIARGTPGFSGADLANLVNEAALLATRRQKNMVDSFDVEDAKDKIMMGAPRNSAIMSPEEVKNTAWHEAGHALVALHMGENSDPIHKATIVPRGQALGMVMRLPEKDRVSYTRARLKAEMAVAYGGRWAEEIHGGKDAVTTGASNDIQQATNIATKMIREWGFSDKLGLLRYNEPEQQSYLGQFGARARDVSEQTARIIDQEIKELADGASNTAKAVLYEHKDQLEVLANALIEHETLTGEEIKRLVFDGKPVVRNYDTANDNSNENQPRNAKGKKPGGAGPAPGGM